MDEHSLYSFDTETSLILPGRAVPTLVCASYATAGGSGLLTREEAPKALRRALEAGKTIVGANIAFDMAVMLEADPSLLGVIFDAYREGSVFDVMIAEQLHAIAEGTLGIDPRTGGALRDPTTNRPMRRYSLAILTDIILGRKDAKARDDWRLSYALLAGIDPARWPSEARQYPIDDAENTLAIALAQLERNQNLGNMYEQVEAAFALHLGACWGLRVDGQRLEALTAEVERKHAEAAVRYQAKGWVRADGTQDQAAFKRSIAVAYGASVPCDKCERGQAGGKKCVACDGTGLVLDKVPRSDKGNIKTDRDTLMESGDDDLATFGEDEFEKIRTTFVPWLRKGVRGPMVLRPNVLVASGRCSYEDPIHQIPRHGGVRECFVARPGYVFASTDYSAGELATLAQFTYWIIGTSHMREAMLKSRNPGILHSELGAAAMNLSLDEFLARLKQKDKACVDMRQAAKPFNFGAPAGMGSVKIVLTSRKKASGWTPCENGPATNERGERGYWGIRFCILAGKAERCGEKMKTKDWREEDIPPICAKCFDAAEVLRKAFFKKFAEMNEYRIWVADRVEKGLPAESYVWDREKRCRRTVRVRGGCDFTSMSNHGFQSLLSDVFKLAFVRLTREAYLGRRYDNGEPSPLYGARFLIAMHDEPVGELPEETAHLAGPRIAEVMMQSGYDLAPDVVWLAETALARRLSKSMEPVYEDGRLVCWESTKG